MSHTGGKEILDLIDVAFQISDRRVDQRLNAERFSFIAKRTASSGTQFREKAARCPSAVTHLAVADGLLVASCNRQVLLGFA